MQRSPLESGIDYFRAMPPRSTTAPKEASALRVVQAAVQSGVFAPVYYLHGDDDYLKDSAIRELLSAAIDPATRDFNCEIRRGGEIDAETLGSLLATPPMFAERRAVVLRDVGALKKAARQQLDEYLARPAHDTLLLVVSPAGAKADVSIAARAESLDFAPLSPDRVRKWISHHASTALGVDISDDAVQLLHQAVGNDLHSLAGELDKCASYALGAHSGDTRARIDADAVTAVVGVRRGETVTDLLDAVARHDAATAVALVGHVLSQPKTTAVGIVINLSTQTFALGYGRARRDAGVPTSRLPGEYFAYLKEIGGIPGRPWGEAASAWTKHTDAWSADACQRALALLLEADVALKETTVSNPEQTLTSLVLGLCALKPRTRKAVART
jgi:DNA polymerase III subunit delta